MEHKSFIKQVALPIIDFFTSISTLLLLILSLFLVFISSWSDDFNNKINSFVINLTAPLIQIIDRPVDTLSEFNYTIVDYFDVYHKNKLLIERNNYLEKMQLVASEIKLENNRLRKIINYLPQDKYTYKTAKLIANNDSIYTKNGIINAGDNLNLKEGQIVITENGLLGTIYNVSKNYSQVRYITDINSHISVKVGDNKQRAILYGNNTNRMLLKFVTSKNISLGDKVFSSNDGNLLPEGIFIGVVVNIKNNEIFIEPAVKLNNINYVLII